MKCPQTYCEKLKKTLTPERLETISKYGCCAFTLLWCLGIEPEQDLDAIILVNDMIDAGVIEKDCTVHWNEAIEFLTGRNKSEVEFKQIKTLYGLKKRTPVRFDYNKNSHWVGVENEKVCFNSLAHSNCVEKGRPVTARILILKS